MKARSLAIAAALGIAAYLMLAALVHSMTFHPSPYPEGQWGLQAALGAEDVELQAPDGSRLHGWFVPAKAQPPAVTTLYLHGNAGNISHRPDHLEALREAGSETLIIDWRGFGKSEGSPSEQGLYEDAAAAYGWLIEQGRSADRIVLHGESLGTAAAAHLAARRECGAVVLEAPFPSRAAVAGRIVPVIGPLVARGFETAKNIASAACPVLVIHGTADRTIPHELGRAVFEAARQPKVFWSVAGGGHSDVVAVTGREYVARLRLLYESLER